MFILLALACGKKDSDNGGGSAKRTTTGLTTVGGKIYVNSVETPAENYQVLVYNHTIGTSQFATVDGKGEFSLPISEFTDTQRYSFHILDYNLSYVAAIKFAGENALNFAAGDGMNIGTITLHRSSLGILDTSLSTLTGSAAGGFSVAAGVAVGLDVMTPPSLLGSVVMASELLVFEPMVLLQGFYQRANNPQFYGASLRRLSKLKFFAQAASGNTLNGASIRFGSKWLKSARLSEDDNSLPENAPLWTKVGNGIATSVNGGLAASVFAQQAPTTSDTAMIYTNLNNNVQLLMPRQLSRVIAVPPLAVGIGQNASAVSAIDYSTPGSENGLTLPFCRAAGDIDLQVSAPIDGAGTSLVSSYMGSVEANFDYFVSRSGVDTKVAVSAANFASPFAAAYSDVSSASASRTWDPATSKLTFALAATTSPVTLTFFSGLFLTTIGSETVSKIRLRVVYTDGSNRTGFAVWLRGC